MVEPGKMFVGGLSKQTTKEGLQNHFEKFGTVTDSVVMINAIDGASRGFGFVTFLDPSSVNKVLAEPNHILDDKKIDPKPATAKNKEDFGRSEDYKQYGGMGGGGGGGGGEDGGRKVFVGGLPQDVTADYVKAYFERFGKVKEVVLKYDKHTSRMRGFGFVEFFDSNSASTPVGIHFHEMNNKRVEVKLAEPRHMGLPPHMGGGTPQSQYHPGHMPSFQDYDRGHGGGSDYSAGGYGNGFGYNQHSQYGSGNYGAYSGYNYGHYLGGQQGTANPDHSRHEYGQQQQMTGYSSATHYHSATTPAGGGGGGGETGYGSHHATQPQQPSSGYYDNAAIYQQMMSQYARARGEQQQQQQHGEAGGAASGYYGYQRTGAQQ